MARVTKRTGLLGAALACALAAGVARADTSDDGTRSTARAVAMEGVAALQKGDADVASAKLEKAYQVLKVPTVGLWSARALVKRGLLLEASERFEATVQLPVVPSEKAVQPQARKDAASELEALRPRIPTIAITVEGASGEVKVSVDGVAVPSAFLGERRPVNPGKHHVVAEVGGDQAEQSVTLGEGDKLDVPLRFIRKAKVAVVVQPSLKKTELPIESVVNAGVSPTKFLGYAAMGVGGAALGMGAVAGVIAMQKHSKIENDTENCVQGKCLASTKTSDVNSMRAFRTISTAGFVAGGVFAVTGFVLVLSAKPNRESAQASPSMTVAFGPGSATLMGEF